MRTKGFLNALDKLFDSPEKWAQGHSAYDSNGNPVSCLSPDAVKWCILGGVGKVCGLDNKDQETLIAILTRAMHKLPGSECYLGYWNDRPKRTFRDIRELIIATKAEIDSLALLRKE